MKKSKLDNFKKMVFTDSKLKKMLNSEDFKNYLQSKQNGKGLSFELATKIAEALKKWAIKMGATHYTHWFFPLTGKFAEKQVCFLDKSKSGNIIKSLDATALIKGEIDASSFPSGGQRMTFEARGYTIWDYSSPIFIKADYNGNKVLYIPAAFCTYNGLAVDEKTPLIRSVDVLNHELTKLLKFLNIKVDKTIINVGVEQEYFLIDNNLYLKRIDLLKTGRTIFGANTIISQQNYNHYCSSINSKTSAFMHHLDEELWKVGILAKVQHNEVAPSQYEIVPMYENVNVSSDQNQLLIQIINQIALKHGFKALFHEKPFSNINGSGKHINFSISTNTGLNLFNINHVGKDVFALMISSVVAAVDKHYDLLRVATSSFSNDLRLGGNEAPPSIISVFLGEDILQILQSYLDNLELPLHNQTILDINASSILTPTIDLCDRNRTSPFAYTGGKFEFRALGSYQSVAFCNTILISILADEIKLLYKKLKKYKDVNLAIKNIIIENVTKHSRIIFNGNNYDKSWIKEAKNRGLISFSNSIKSYKCLLFNKNIKLFETLKVLNKTEIEIRYNTLIQNYIDSAEVELKTMIYMCKKQIIPSLESLLKSKLKGTLIMKKFISDKLKVFEYNTWLINLQKIKNQIKILNQKEKQCSKIINKFDKALFINTNLLTEMNKLRSIYDSFENDIPNNFVPFPTYEDLLFS